MWIVITFTIVISYYYTLLHHISISFNQNSACMPCQKRKTKRKKSQKNWYLEACRNLLLPCLAPVCSLNESLSSSILFAWITMFTVEELQAQQIIECWHPYTCDFLGAQAKRAPQILWLFRGRRGAWDISFLSKFGCISFHVFDFLWLPLSSSEFLGIPWSS